MSEAAPAIRAESLSRQFGDVKAVDGFSLSVAEGEIFGLVGPDGAGKTTIMRLLAGILSATAGEAWVGGRSVRHEAEVMKQQIGYMSQGFSLYADLTVMENLNFYADIYGVPSRQRPERISQLLAFSNLGPFQKRLAGNLSGGMRQKLSLSCVLIHTPRILLLDEPTNGVDPLSRREFWRILYQLLRERVTVFVSTSYLDEAERCSRIGLLHAGRLLAVGSPDEVKRLVEGVIWDVETSEPRRAARVLRQEPMVLHADMFGDRIHAFTANAGAASHLTDVLVRNGFRVRAISPIEPSLEDVFVSVMAGHQAHGSVQ